MPRSGVPRLAYLGMLEIFATGFGRSVRGIQDRKVGEPPCPGQVQDWPRDTEKVRTRKDLAEHKPDVRSQMYS